VPQLREEAAASHFHAGDRLQGFRLVQDGQPPRREELGFEQLRHRQVRLGQERRVEDRYEDRDQKRHEERQEDRDEGAGQAGAEERRCILTTARALVRDARAVATSFGADECPFLAGAVAFQLFFAIIPLLALVVGVLGFAYGSERAQEELGQLLRDIYPSATAQETRIVRQLVEGRGLSLGVGIVGTILATGAIHSALDKALAVILGTGGKRGFLRGHAEAFAFAGALVLLAAISLVVSLGAGPLAPLLGFAIGYVLFYCVYRFVPRSRVGGPSARVAALVSAVLWEVAKIAFGFFTRSLGIFTAYGPIAFAAAMLTWIYVTAVIILIGAEVIKLRRA
jgi:membrane protein